MVIAIDHGHAFSAKDAKMEEPYRGDRAFRQAFIARASNADRVALREKLAPHLSAEKIDALFKRPDTLISNPK